MKYHTEWNRRAVLAAAFSASAVLLLWPVHAAPRYQRIVSVGADVTEIIHKLGFGSHIVATDIGSAHTPGYKKWAKLGSRRKLSSEGILALRPSLFIHTEDCGPAPTLMTLKASGIPMVSVPYRNTPEAISTKIEFVANTLNAVSSGKRLAGQIAADFADTAKVVAQIPAHRRQRVLFLHSVTGGRLSGAGGSGAAPDAIIRLAGGINAISSVQGYKPASAEAIVSAAPDLVLMSKRPDRRVFTPAEVFSIPALAPTPAGRNNNLLVLPGTFMQGFGPRTAEAIRRLATALYPELRFPPLRYPPVG